MDNATKIMHKLYDQGLLKHTDEEGQVVPVDSFEEYQQLREMKELEIQSQQSQQLSHAPSNQTQQTQQLAMGSSLVGGDIGANMGAAMTNTDAQAFLPDSERSRPGMQHEVIEDQPMTIQGFLNRPEDSDLG